MGNNFTFMNELTISSSLIQTNVQNFYEQAANAEKNLTRDTWMSLCNTREAAEYACRILVYHYNIAFKATGLKGYVGQNNGFTKKIDERILEELRFISNKTTKIYREDAKAARASIEHLYKVAEELYEILGGKGSKKPLQLDTEEPKPSSRQAPVLSVKELFSMIEEPVREGIIKDGLDGGASKIGAMEQTINDILGILKKGDSKFVSKEQFESALKKLEDGMKKQFELGKSDTMRRYRELENKLDGIQSAMGHNTIQIDDLEAKLTILLNQMDNIQAKQENNMEYVAKIMESADKIMENFVKINEQNLSALGDGAKYILGEIKKASQNCADIINHFSEEVKATSQRYQNARNQRTQTAPRETMKKSFPGKRTWTLPGMDQFFRFARTWMLTKKHNSYRIMYTVAVLMIAGWITLAYLGFTREMTVLIPWKIGMLTWYFITWSIAVLVKVCLGFTTVRTICYGITQIQEHKRIHKKQVLMIVRRLTGAVIVFGLGLYIHQHFYEMAREYLGWKPILLADRMDEIQYYFRVIFYNWGY